MALEIELTRLHGPLQNYGVLIHEPKSGACAAVDAGDARPILEVLEAKGWSLTQLWITHHHPDHTDGIEDLKSATGCEVFGPAGSQRAIAGIDSHVKDGDRITLGDIAVDVLHTPGHTLDMLNFHIASEAVLFAGDTMFVMGCGRLFEGTPEQMFASLKKLGRLPPETLVYCAHEYTVSNGEFAAAQLPDNAAIAERLAEVKALRAENRPTVPTTINLELRTNPFLLASNSAEFARLRKAKDVA